MLYKQVKQMYMIKYLKSKNAQDIASFLGIHPYTFKLLSSTCSKYTLDELKMQEWFLYLQMIFRDMVVLYETTAQNMI